MNHQNSTVFHCKTFILLVDHLMAVNFKFSAIEIDKNKTRFYYS
ncbi:MAG: hypothetical protein JWP57_4604 [Spirosoma sp.]|nr:hypothetical protein [Spirosoma sp.]